MVDEVWKIVLLTAYFKGDCDDLTKSEYATIAAEGEEIFNDCEEKFEWEEACATHLPASPRSLKIIPRGLPN